MTNFEKIAETPEALGDFLSHITVANAPWDKEFHKMFCDYCEQDNCDEGCCPHEGERDNPTWWLKLGGEPGEVLGLSIWVKAAFPILWGREYYTVAGKQKETRAPCVCCDNTGKVTIKGVEYLCPRCKGDWREKEVVGTTTVYSVEKWMLDEIEVSATKTILTYYTQSDAGISAEDLAAAVEKTVAEFITWQCGKLGRDINPSRLIGELMKTGVKRVELTDPVFTTLQDGSNRTVPQVAALRSAPSIVNGGYENE